jgi:hypothetical protein
MSSNTDVLYQKVTLFIEGVEVPYSSISISQAIGNIPSASLELPPSPGLMDIIRYYQPKVHIFYEDPVLGKDRLLFWGYITSNSYSASVQSASINFQCIHKNHVINHLTLDFSGYPAGAYANFSPGENMFMPSSFGSTHSLVLALRGIDRVRLATETSDEISVSNPNVINASQSLLDPKFADVKDRWVGMPSAMMNMWNQLKASAYYLSQYNSILVAMYIPLIEDGLKLFSRVSGHNTIEDAVNASKQDICDDTGNKTDSSKPIMVPPAFRLHSMSAIQTSLSVEAIGNMLGFMGEKTGFFRLFSEFYLASEYEVITLASPALVPKDPKKTSVHNSDDLMAIDVVIKPQLPFYYSPLCNVILPNMYSSIQVEQNESVVPSRVSMIHSAMPGDEQKVGLYYRGPHSIRESIVTGLSIRGITRSNETPKPDSTSLPSVFDTPTSTNAKVIAKNKVEVIPSLHESTGASYNVPGKYELGSGYRPKQVIAPSWLAYLVKRCNESVASGTVLTEEHPADDSDIGKITKDLHDGWVFTHARKNGNADASKELLDPNFKGSGVAAFQRILFAAADYDYTKEVLSSKTGSISCIFNPYIIPGYPMDIVAKSPNLPSFHALCAAVTHTFTADSISTSVSFVSAATYSELSNYDLMPSHPWLQTSLQLYNVDRDATSGAVTSVMSTIINNPKAKLKADSFYMSVLGVGAAAPSDLVNFKNMEIYSNKREGGVLNPGTGGVTYGDNGGHQGDDTTGIGNLKLVHRPIETRESIEKNFNYSFIDLTKENYTIDSLTYGDPKLNPIKDDGIPLEPGASLFLDYPETVDFLKANNIQVV